MTIKEYLILKLGIELYNEIEPILSQLYKVGEKNGMNSMVRDSKFILDEIFLK